MASGRRLDVDHAAAQPAGGGGQAGKVVQGGAGDFQRKAGGPDDSASHSHQSAAGTDIQGGSELKELFAPLITAAHENWNRQG